MILTIDVNDRRPIYQQIADGIRSLIATGQLAEGQPLPSVRQVAADLAVNLNTIATAYRELQEEGLITVKHGSGATVASRFSHHHSDEELRGTLRNAITKLILSGRKRSEIRNIVDAELRGLLKGVKP